MLPSDPNRFTLTDVSDTPFTDPEDPGAIVPAVPVPVSGDDACFSFPNLSVNPPEFKFEWPTFQLPAPNCCPELQGPVVDTGAIANQVGEWLSLLPRPDLKFNYTDPKTKPAVSTATTLIATPAEPPHVSAEAVKIIPDVATEFVTQLGTSLLLAAGSTVTAIGGVVAALKSRADALGDQAAKAMGNGLTQILASGETIGAMASGLSASVWTSVNQAVSMLPIRQIPVNGWNPISAKMPQLEWFNDGQTRAKWPNNGRAPNSLGALNNGLNIVKDLYNLSGAACVVKAGLNLFAGSANALSRGLGALSWGLQVEGMLRNLTVLPFHIDGLDALAHDWRHWCKVKIEFDGGTGPQLTSRQAIHDEIDVAGGCASAGAMPGNLLYAANPDGDMNNIGSLQNLAPALAAGLGSPHVDTLRHYVTDPDPRYDGISADLPDMFRAGDPRLAKLHAGLAAFQQVLTYIKSLLNLEVEDLRTHATEIGGGFVRFVIDVRTDLLPELDQLDRLATHFINNRLTALQSDLVVAFAQQWDGLAVDLTVLTDANRKAIVKAVLGPRDALGNAELADLLQDAGDILTNFGGPAGPEVAYSASVHAGLTRCLVILNNDDEPEADRYARTRKVLHEIAPHAQEMTHGGPTRDWVLRATEAATPDGNFAQLSRATLPTAAKSAQQTLTYLEKTTSALTTMQAQHNGKDSLADLSQPANDIDHEAENADTVNFTAAAQAAAREAQKKILTQSLPLVMASVKGFEQAGITDQAINMIGYTERMVQEQANAQAMASLSKVTGTRLNQAFEGMVNQAKFILTQAGQTLTFDAPFTRMTARKLVFQGGVTLHEADAYNVRVRWHNVVSRELVTFATLDYAVAASGKLTQVSDTAKHVSRKGREVVDALKITHAVGGVPGVPTPAPAVVEQTLDATSQTASVFAAKKIQLTAGVAAEIVAANEVIIHVGACQIKVTGTRIDLNPLPALPPTPVTPSAHTLNYTEAPVMDTHPDKGVALLPSRKGRNPVPVAAPYVDPAESGFMG